MQLPLHILFASILNCSEHFLIHRFLLSFFHFSPYFLHIFHFLQLISSIFQSPMGIGVHCNTDVRMSHQVLQSFGIHARLRHIGTVGVSTYMRCDVRHLHSVNIIITLYHVIESMLPVHCYFWISVLVKNRTPYAPLSFSHISASSTSSRIARKQLATSGVIGVLRSRISFGSI